MTEQIFFEGDYVLVPQSMDGKTERWYAGSVERAGEGWIRCRTPNGIIQLHPSRLLPLSEKDFFNQALKGGLTTDELEDFLTKKMKHTP